mgnify:FL=1|jgi:hypothetical protein
MSELIIEQIFNYGLPTVMLVGVCWFLVRLDRLHRVERKECREAYDKGRQETDAVLRELTEVIRDRHRSYDRI